MPIETFDFEGLPELNELAKRQSFNSRRFNAGGDEDLKFNSEDNDLKLSSNDDDALTFNSDDD